MEGAVRAQLVRPQEEALTLAAIGWAAYGWEAAVLGLVACYYLLRFRLRRQRQSLFLAAIVGTNSLFGAEYLGLIPRPLGLALLLLCAAGATVFLLVLLDDVRRGALKKPGPVDVEFLRGPPSPR